MLTFGSLFSGVGGLDLGFERAGLRCVWQVECDRDANAVRRRHWPDVLHVRDVSGMSRRPKRLGHWLDHYERPDVIIGGFPCQDVSVAGKRAGLAGGRSGLWWQMLRVIRGLRPSCVVWENVPGLLSADGGRDFARVLLSLGNSGYRGGWRILDAQYFGVPQRRRRVFGVFFSGRSGAERAAEVLALRDGLRGDSPTRGAAGEDSAGTLANCIRANGVGTSRAGDTRRQDNVVARCLTRREGKGPNSDAGSGNLVVFDSKQSGESAGAAAPTLRAMSHDRSHANAGGQLAGGRTHADTKLHVVGAVAVRRLTPLECERLMGWPDDWTRWRDDGTELKDGPRYRLCGNGAVGTVAEWIAKRLVANG